MEVRNGMTRRLDANGNQYVICPECGCDMSPSAKLCRDCFYAGGGHHAPIYRAASERGEASDRSRVKADDLPKRAYTKNPKQKR